MPLPLAALALAAAAPADAPPQRVGECGWIEGRLTLGNGTPATRIWPRGTRRPLGVTNARFESEAADVVPANVARYLRANRTDRLWGRFLVCPLAPERAGWMRPVRVAAARNLSPAP
jgi:hypothetical protein